MTTEAQTKENINRTSHVESKVKDQDEKKSPTKMVTKKTIMSNMN